MLYSLAEGPSTYRVTVLDSRDRSRFGSHCRVIHAAQKNTHTGSSQIEDEEDEDGQLEIKHDETNGFRGHLKAVVRIKRVVLHS